VVKEKRRCQCCGKTFRPRPQVPNQQYCSQRACQNARKRAWQKDKRERDPDYRENQRSAQKRWADRNPDYWRRWREGHPAYQDRNRQQQTERNARRQARAEDAEQPSSGASEAIAKSDVWTAETVLDPGTYRVVPWAGGLDCKDGRVISGNLFLISPIDTKSA
jgi:hypothetical protein